MEIVLDELLVESLIDRSTLGTNFEELNIGIGVTLI